MRLLDVNKTELQLIHDSCGFNLEIEILSKCFVDSLSEDEISCLDEWQSLYGAFPCNFGYLYGFICKNINHVQVFQGLSLSMGMRGSYVEFYGNGYMKNDLIFYYDKKNSNSSFDGKVVFYYEYPSADTVGLTADHGNVQSEVEFKKGILWSVKSIFSKQGKKLKIGSFKNGKGQLNFYDREGKLYSVLTYVAGRTNGLAKFFSSDRQFYLECNIINGSINGICKVFNSDKELIRTFNAKF